MMMAILTALAVASASAASAHYGDTLLAQELSRHPTLDYASISLDNSNNARFEAGTAGPRSKHVVVPLLDALGTNIGTLELAFDRSPGKNTVATIESDVSRHVYSKAVLAEPDPFVAGAVRSSFGQALVERELSREPRLVTIAFHVALPERDNQIIASNFGRIGKAADSDDQRVIASSTILQEETNNGQRLAVELPLLDRSGRTIGALSTSFLTGPGPGEKAIAYRSALRVQHDLSRSIARLERLAK